MERTDAIIYLARQEARKYRFVTKEEDINQTLPYFEISKNDVGKYDVKGYNYKGHDNEPRMGFLTNYIKNNVIPNMDPSLNPCGFYNVELHDSYAHLENKKDYTNCLTFSKNRNDHHVMLLPDLYNISGYGGLLSLKDPYSWEQKKDKIGFFGTTTGNRDPRKNERIQMALWSVHHRDISDIYITHVAQMTVSEIQQAIPNFSQITHPHVPELQQYQYKFLLNINGNTCCWNRMPMILNSSSLCLNMPSADMSFYYPLLHHKTHFVQCQSTDDIERQYTYYMHNPKETLFITQNANQFVKETLSANHALLYTVHLFEEMAEQR